MGTPKGGPRVKRKILEGLVKRRNVKKSTVTSKVKTGITKTLTLRHEG